MTWWGGEEQYTDLWTGEKHQTLVQTPTSTKGIADYKDTAQALIETFFENIKPHINAP